MCRAEDVTAPLGQCLASDLRFAPLAPGMASKSGRTPLFLLKTKSTPSDGYEEFFDGHQDGRFEPIFVPVLEHRFSSRTLNAVTHLAENHAFSGGRTTSATQYGGMIFTSQRAVEAFSSVVNAIRQAGKDVDLLFPASLPLYVVGPATLKSLKALDLPCPILGGDSGNGEALAHFMLSHYNEHRSSLSESQSKPPLLFLVGEQRRDIIPKTLQSESLPSDRQIQVEELVVYETGEMESFRRDFADSLEACTHVANADISKAWVVVFSPTGCKAMLSVLGLLDDSGSRADPSKCSAELRQAYVATIGPTTRDHLRSTFGFEADVCAPNPSPQGIADGIAEYLRS